MRSLILLFLAALAMTSFAPEKEVGMVNWLTFEEAVEANKSNPKKFFIDVYTDWCSWCIKMDKSTFMDKDVIRALDKDFYAVKFNAEQKDTIKLNDSKFIFDETIGRRGGHELAKELLNGRMAFPSFVYLDENVMKIMPSPGYKKPAELLLELSYISTDAYKKMNLTEWVDRAE